MERGRERGGGGKKGYVCVEKQRTTEEGEERQAERETERETAHERSARNGVARENIDNCKLQKKTICPRKCLLFNFHKKYTHTFGMAPADPTCGS